jgi:hypothetical protein
MTKIALLVGIAMAFALAAPASAKSLVLKKGCYSGYHVTYANAKSQGGGTQHNYHGDPMEVGWVAVHDNDAIPDGTHLTFPDVRGATIFTAMDHAREEGKVAVIWQDDDAPGFNYAHTRLCVVD